jgi:hypothetical protein
MSTFDKEQFINDVNHTINRVSNMKDKVKALKILDMFQDKNEQDYYMFIFGDNEIWSIYNELIFKWQDIYYSLTEKESNLYGNTLPDEMLDINWSKNTRELFHKRVADANHAAN